MTGPHKPGRPPRSTKAADIRITIRLTAAEHRTLVDAAGESNLGEWVRTAALKAAARKR